MVRNLTDGKNMPRFLQQLVDRIRSGREVSVVIVTTRGTETARVPLRDLKRF